MFTCFRPVRRRVKKPMTQAMKEQFRSENRLRRFDQGMSVVYGMIGLFLIIDVI